MTVLVDNVLDVLRFGQTKRYHTQVLLKEQDVAQHVYNMLWLIMIMTNQNPSWLLLVTALQHDAGEQATGDMPGHTKRLLNLDSEMDKAEVEHLIGVGVVVAPHYELSERETAILTLADRLEGLLYCCREVRMGNTEVEHIAARYMAWIEEMDATGPFPSGSMPHQLIVKARSIYEQSCLNIGE